MFTVVSGNAKTGPIPVSGSQSNTCPLVCPLRGSCYASYGPIAIHWRRLDNGAGILWSEFLIKVRRLHRGQLWRHLQFGDIQGDGKRIDAKRLSELTDANKGKSGFGYTHHNVLVGADGAANAKAIAAANKGGLAINLSGNNPDHADKLKALGIAPVVSIVPTGSPNTTFTKAGNKIVLCRAQTREGVTCSSCRLCANQKRSVIVGFLPHGNGAKWAEKVAVKGAAPALAAA